MQSGGWTVTWQGRSIEDRTLNPRSYYKGHTTIAEGISGAVKAAKGKVTTDINSSNIDVAIVVFGEQPYAEGIDAAIEASDAFVAAWLPGSEGAGVADVLISGENGKPAFDFQGKLPFAWPQTGQGLTETTAKYQRGYGLTYSQGR